MPTATDTRHAEAVRLRRLGLSFSQIARELGYGPYPSAARYAYLAGVRAEGQTVVNTNRQFGVEIEFYNVRPSVVIQALAEVGIDCEYEGYNHHTRPHWKIVRDGSVTSRNTGQGSGLEMVSPILSGTEGLRKLETVLTIMARVGAKVNSTCGLHVHIDQAGLTGKERRNYFLAYVQNQRVFDRLVSPSRRGFRNTYTRAYDAQEVPQYAEWVEEGQTDFYSNARYHNINVTSYGKYGTFEVRHHQGTLNARKVINWVKLNLSLHTWSKTVSEDSVPAEFASVEEMLTTVGVDDDVKTFWLRREAKLNPVSVAA